MVRPGLAPAVFLDRDGVIVVPEFRDRRSFAPRRLGFQVLSAAASLGRLKRAGFLLAVVTNQPDVGRGLIPRAEVEAMHEIITRVAGRCDQGATTGRPTSCSCRKPKPGMILAAAAELGDLERSFMVGDRKSDGRPRLRHRVHRSRLPKTRTELPTTSCARSRKPPTSSKPLSACRRRHEPARRSQGQDFRRRCRL